MGIKINILTKKNHDYDFTILTKAFSGKQERGISNTFI